MPTTYPQPSSEIPQHSLFASPSGHPLFMLVMISSKNPNDNMSKQTTLSAHLLASQSTPGQKWAPSPI